MIAQQKQIDDLLFELGLKYPDCGFYIGAGWFPVVAQALRDMCATEIPFTLGQVKQKFCTLRLYWSCDPSDNISDEQYKVLDAIVKRAEQACDTLCESCGKPHGLRIPRAGTALCAECSADQRARQEEAWSKIGDED